MYGVEPTFWLSLISLLAFVLLLLVSFNTIMRKLLKIERKKFQLTMLMRNIKKLIGQLELQQ
jgi:hypothetical protein